MGPLWNSHIYSPARCCPSGLGLSPFLLSSHSHWCCLCSGPCLLFHRLSPTTPWHYVFNLTYFQFALHSPSECYFYHKDPLGSFSSSKSCSDSYLLPERMETSYMGYQTLSDWPHNHVPNSITAILFKQGRTTWSLPPLNLCTCSLFFLLFCSSYPSHAQRLFVLRASFFLLECWIDTFPHPTIASPKSSDLCFCSHGTWFPCAVIQDVLLELFASLFLLQAISWLGSGKASSPLGIYNP